MNSHTDLMSGFKCVSVINNDIAVKEENGIYRMCNWKVMAQNPNFDMFMKSIFTELITIIQYLYFIF